MNFDEYVRTGFRLYEDFAFEVRRIIDASLDLASGLTRPQALQSRAKSPKSLRDRLAESEDASEDRVEVRKDLAGVRLIFYTNGDLERFAYSNILHSNFKIDRDAIRFHTPTDENRGRKYRGAHFVVELNDERLQLPEYKRFAGIRCEIQIQTILNHAWSETTHDTIYKDNPTPGFGIKKHAAITARFNKIMDAYLLKAGYELDKAIQEFRELREGRELFKGDPFGSLQAAANNNERFDTLTAIQNHIVPLYDDLPGVYADMVDALVSAAEASRGQPSVEPPQPASRYYSGHDSDDVVSVVLSILRTTRLAGVEIAFNALVRLQPGSTTQKQREAIASTATDISAFDIISWPRIGLVVQFRLLNAIDGMSEELRERAADIVRRVWTACLSTEMSGSSLTSYNAVTFHRGAVPSSDQLRILRNRALDGLLRDLSATNDENERKSILSAVWSGMQLVGRGDEPTGLEKMLVIDLVRVITHLSQILDRFSYEMRERLEDRLLLKYRRVSGYRDRFQADGDFSENCERVLRTIVELRDKIEADEQYVQFKTLVGFEGTFPPQWENLDSDIEVKSAYRSQRAKEFIEAIDENNFDKWTEFIARCAATKLTDGATFPVFRFFLRSLAMAKPAIALKLLLAADENLLYFTSEFLRGLAESHDSGAYEAAIRYAASDDRRVADLVLHYTQFPQNTLEPLISIFDRAQQADNTSAVIECLSFALNRWEEADVAEKLIAPCFSYLTARKNTGWVNSVWYSEKASEFFMTMPDKMRELVLGNLFEARKIKYQAEHILSRIAHNEPMRVWQFLYDRASRPDDTTEFFYEAVPYSISELAKGLSSDPKAVIVMARNWFGDDQRRFRHTLQHAVAESFRELPPDFLEALSALVQSGGDTDIDFVLDLLLEFDGKEQIHGLLKDIVAKLPSGSDRLRDVEACIEEAGTFVGEFGRVEALRQRLSLVKVWQDDPRAPVKAFAATYLGRLEQKIAQEYSQAERHLELRKRDFEEDEDGAEGG